MKPQTGRDGSRLEAEAARTSSREFLAGELPEMLARGQGDDPGTAASAAGWVLYHADASAAKGARRRP